MIAVKRSFEYSALVPLELLWRRAGLRSVALIPEGLQKVSLSCFEGVERPSFQWPTLVELAALFYGTGLIFSICRHSAVGTSKMFVVLSRRGQRGADEKVHVNALSLLISRYSDSKAEGLNGVNR